MTVVTDTSRLPGFRTATGPVRFGVDDFGNLVTVHSGGGRTLGSRRDLIDHLTCLAADTMSCHPSTASSLPVSAALRSRVQSIIESLGNSKSSAPRPDQ